MGAVQHRGPAVIGLALLALRIVKPRDAEDEPAWKTRFRVPVIRNMRRGHHLVVVTVVPARFYQHHGFAPVPGNLNRLVQKIDDVAAALEG